MMHGKTKIKLNKKNIYWSLFFKRGPGSSVGMATGWTVRGSNPG